ncbi:DUF3899 domain-containing protein [Vagococcus sp. DIV0080]|mgnify:CR=1 FL=1|uniref:DUF3899 domain-containing protein n=1 Tax=Candidatus Vagococcus giribetii TaxID=2230876 RepID=A0ABS3HQA7_9ENTE|nr:DUF3899 domain-containing protein [Vagococcus sp. DIV0080]MBO0475918.1 DUF3899 domain-containing protein [Vagococcus sp. DIV0080]
MTVSKKICISLGVLILGVPLFNLIIQQEVTLRNLSDSFFMVSLVFIVIGAGISILSSGFFDFFQKNMKQLIQRRRKNEPKDYIPFSQIFKKKPTYWLVVGGTLLVLSFVLALFV